ncbi:phenolic acid decarboxylase [Kribbella ginsengisoli]|uniref:MoaF-like domain-containing protein n=1 Tax=Kribbella ginsengisoli TaxID=363865 RepID=A0ABP6YDB6_9ACTN
MDIVGQKVQVTYENGSQYEVEYLSPDKLRWTALAGETAGNSGVESPVITELGDDRYWLNWLEDDGTTISQVLDLASATLTEFTTYTDAGDRVKVFQQPAMVVLGR